MAVANDADFRETYLDEDSDADFDFEGFHLDEYHRANDWGYRKTGNLSLNLI